jgi:NAD(P)H-dependent flavin oxidoreductase YrpB (nitropropane dioxygenase family)
MKGELGLDHLEGRSAMCGQVAGLISDLMTAEEVIKSIISGVNPIVERLLWI